MISTNDFKRGVRIELDGDPYVIVDYGTQSPSARSANTLVKAKLRNLRTKQLIDRNFKAGERVATPDFRRRIVEGLRRGGWFDRPETPRPGTEHEAG